MDESSVYWTQQAQEDQQPKFKNDHQKPEQAEREILTTESLHPPSIQSPSQLSPSIYQRDDQQDQQLQNDDQQDQKRDEYNEQSTPLRRKDFTVAFSGIGSATVVDLNGNPAVQSQDDNSDDQRELTRSDLEVIIHEDDDDENVSRTQSPQNPVMGGEVIDHNDETDDDEVDNSWQAKQNRWTTASADDDVVGSDDSNIGYQLLTCRVTNNFYTNFRW